MGSFALATLWSAVLGVPLLIFVKPLLMSISSEVWLWLWVSGLCQMLYLVGLTLAYQRGELSILYPLIRSSPLLILLFGGLLLGTLDRVGTGAIAGILMIVVGCLFLPMRHFTDFNIKHYVNTASAFALMAATATAGYSLIDDHATRLMRTLLTERYHVGLIALTYVVLQAWTASACLMVVVWFRPEWRIRITGDSSLHKDAMMTGLLIMGTYALVVWAMAYAKDVSYVAAFRQISILIGVVLGITLLKEHLTAPKVLGSFILFGGLILVTLGKD